jgi:competence protein ComEA
MNLGRREQLVLLLLAFAVVFGLGAKYALHRQTPVSQPAVEEREKPLEVSVHVAGAVYHPGVYRLRAGSRVIDAVQEAGGACWDANVDVLNLAQILEDGQKVLVPVKVPAGEAPAANSFVSPPVAGAATVSGTLININTADARALESLPGIGPALAQRIVEHRAANGPFTSPDDLINVPGIGEKKLDQLRDYICVQ